MKKKLLILVIFAMAFSCFAQIAEYQPGEAKPSKNEVFVVLKVNLSISIDKDFIAATRGVLSEKDKDDTFTVTSKSKKSQLLTFNKNKNAIFINVKDDNNVSELNYVEYNLFGSDSATIFIPFDFSFKIPADVKAVYLGTFNVKVNSDYEITDIKRIDEYEDAQKELDEACAKYGKIHYDLVRIEDLNVKTAE